MIFCLPSLLPEVGGLPGGVGGCRVSVAVAGENFTTEVVFNECQWPANGNVVFIIIIMFGAVESDATIVKFTHFPEAV